MDTRTKEVSTEYGTTTIEITDCDSCGNTVAKDETVEFTIGDRSGHACEYCTNNGPINFPERVIEFSLPSENGESGIVWLLLGVILAPIFATPIFADSILENEDYFADGYVFGVLAVLLWVVLPVIFIF